jgi:hypothetical protein
MDDFNSRFLCRAPILHLKEWSNEADALLLLLGGCQLLAHIAKVLYRYFSVPSGETWKILAAPGWTEKGDRWRTVQEMRGSGIVKTWCRTRLDEKWNGQRAEGLARLLPWCIEARGCDCPLVHVLLVGSWRLSEGSHVLVTSDSTQEWTTPEGGIESLTLGLARERRSHIAGGNTSTYFSVVFRNFGLCNFAGTFPELTNHDSRSSLPDPTCWPNRIWQTTCL